MNNIKTYETPDFDATIYEVEDAITASSLTFGDQDPDSDGWWG